MAANNDSAQAKITALLEAHAEPVGVSAAWKLWGKSTGMKNSNMLSIAMSGAWHSLKIGRVPKVGPGPGKWYYCSKIHPGALMFDPKVKKKGRTVKKGRELVPHVPGQVPPKEGRQVKADKVLQAEFIPRGVQPMPRELRTQSEPVEIRVGGKIITIRDE